MTEMSILIGGLDDQDARQLATGNDYIADTTTNLDAEAKTTSDE